MALDQLLKRHFWVVVVPMTGLAGFFSAQGVSNVIGMSLSPDESARAVAPLSARMAAPQAAAGSHRKSADSLFSRNPFDSVTGTLNPKPEPSAEAAASAAPLPPEMTDPYLAPACSGVKLLIVTASADPDWSFAAFSVGSGDKAKTILRRRGGDVEGKTVKYVKWDRAWLETSPNVLCQATMFRPVPSAAPVATAAPPPPPPAPGGAPGVPADIMKGIQKLGPREFNVDRGVVDKILENQATLMTQARIVPEQENGKLVGIRLYGVRADTLLGVLGMENGDRLEKINGFDMTSPEKALEAYARLRTADHLTVAINRGGSAQNIDFNIK